MCKEHKLKPRKQVLQFLKMFNIQLPYDPAIPLLSIYPKIIKNKDSNRYLYNNVHSSINHNSQNGETTQVSINRWMDRRQCGRAVQWNVTQPKKNGALIHATTWMNLGHTVKGERSQTQREKYCMIPLMWGTSNRKIPKVIKNSLPGGSRELGVSVQGYKNSSSGRLKSSGNR